jgi:N-acetylglucosamine transport system permease protein
LIWAVTSSFKSDEEILTDPWGPPSALRWQNWSRAWQTAHIGRYFLNSVLVVALSLLITMLLGSMAAYVLARYRFWGNRIIYYLFVSGLAFPTFLAIIPLFLIMRQLSLLNTYQGLVLVYIAYSLPFTVFFLTAFFKTLPTSIAEAAMIDGAGHTRLFFQVMLPMARSGMVSIGIFNVIGQWAQYLLPVVLMTDPDKKLLTQGIAEISVSAGYEADWSGLFAAVSIIFYAVFQRQIQAGLTAGALK